MDIQAILTGKATLSWLYVRLGKVFCCFCETSCCFPKPLYC